jgi:hypothetical protein
MNNTTLPSYDKEFIKQHQLLPMLESYQPERVGQLADSILNIFDQILLNMQVDPEEDE